MNIRSLLLIGMAAGLIAGCGESKTPEPLTAPPTHEAPVTAVTPDPGGDRNPPSAEQFPSATTTGEMADEQKNLAARNLDPEKIKRGEAIYQANCASCHGPKGQAGPDWRNPGPDGRYPPPPLDGSAHAWHHSTETLEKMIRDGSPAGGMPPWDGKLTNQQIDDVIVWIKSLWPDEIYDLWYKEIEQKLPPNQG